MFIHWKGAAMLLKKAAAVTVLSGVMAIGGSAAASAANASASQPAQAQTARTSAASASHWAHYGWYSDEQTCWDTGFQVYISNPNAISYACYYVDFKFAWDLEIEYS
jgi:hypothetical protein